MSNRRLAEAIQELDGTGETVDHAFLTQERPRWLWPAAMCGFAAIFIATGFTSVTVVGRVCLSTLAVAIVYGRFAKRGALGLTQSRLILTRSSSSRGVPSEIVDSHRVGIEAQRRTRLVTTEYRIDGRRLLMPRAGTDALDRSLTMVD